MFDLPLPVIIGLAMVLSGVILGTWIAIQAVKRHRSNDLLD